MLESFIGAIVGVLILGTVSNGLGAKPANPTPFQATAEMAGGDGN